MACTYSVILLEPEHPGNIGAIARTMANFGQEQLILVNPVVEHLCEEARNRAKHAQTILERAIVAKDIPSFDLLIGTSGKLGDHNNILRLPLTPKQLAAELSHRSGTVGLLFGRESYGLTNEELAQTDLLIHIPTRSEYPILNLSHAVSILLYELTQEQNAEKSEAPLIKPEQKDHLEKQLELVIKTKEFANEHQREVQRKVLKRLLNSSFLTAREAQSLLGFFKKI